eukprot:scaffold28_cov155-Amphora_coffeaeformis.AAC.2
MVHSVELASVLHFAISVISEDVQKMGNRIPSFYWGLLLGTVVAISALLYVKENRIHKAKGTKNILLASNGHTPVKMVG